MAPVTSWCGGTRTGRPQHRLERGDHRGVVGHAALEEDAVPDARVPTTRLR